MSEPLATRADLGWIRRAACGPDTAEVFHGASQENGCTKQHATRVALSICGRCEVREECYRYMLDQPELSRAGTVAAGLVWDSKGRPKLPKALPARACGYCGTTFLPNHPLNRYCGSLCQGRARRVRNPAA